MFAITAAIPEFDGFSIDLCRSMVAMKDVSFTFKFKLSQIGVKQNPI